MGNLISDIKRFFAPALEIKPFFFRAIFAWVFFMIYFLLSIYVIKEFVYLIEIGDKDKFLLFFYGYTLFMVFYFVFNFLIRHWGWAEFYFTLIKQFHRTYIYKFIALDNNSIEKIGTGKTISIIDKGFQDWSGLMNNLIGGLIRFIMTFSFTLYIVFSIGGIYFGVFLILFFVVLFMVNLLNNYALIHRSNRITMVNEYTRHLVKIIMSKFEILQNNKIDSEIKILDKDMSLANYHNIKLNLFLHLMFNIPRFVITLIKIGIFYYIGYGVFIGTFNISDFVGIVTVVTYMDNVIGDTVDLYKNFTKEFGTVRKLWELFDGIPEMPGLYTGNDFLYESGNISIKGLDFGYGDNQVFNNLNLDIKGSQKTAFVGFSGSGKTTLVKLIVGYLHQNSGSIFVDGQDLRDIKLISYYKNIGYLTQEPSVFDGTIIENLTYGVNDEIDDLKIQTAIKLANCEFIYDFRSGLNTQIGEKGVRLSGGQRQRLAIAKIFLKDPKILILDEPTSALDSFAEEEITNALNNLFEGRTVIIIAHRLQTVKHADDIIVFEKGKVVERGLHNDLVSLNGIYARMLELQSGF